MSIVFLRVFDRLAAAVSWSYNSYAMLQGHCHLMMWIHNSYRKSVKTQDPRRISRARRFFQTDDARGSDEQFAG